jgi:hypothetical protein
MDDSAQALFRVNRVRYDAGITWRTIFEYVLDSGIESYGI